MYRMPFLCNYVTPCGGPTGSTALNDLVDCATNYGNGTVIVGQQIGAIATGNSNTAVGYSALEVNTADSNTAVGSDWLETPLRHSPNPCGPLSPS